MSRLLKLLVGSLVTGLLAAVWVETDLFRPTRQNIKTVGVARWSSRPEFGWSVDGFQQGLAENGYVDGHNVRFVVENAETNLERQQVIIQDFIDQQVDLIYSLTTPGTIVAKNETNMVDSPIPVVFSICPYPMESNLISTLEASGNNLVGTRNHVPFSQQYYSFERIFPDTDTLAVIYHKGAPNSKNQVREVRELLSKRGIRVISIAAATPEEIRRELEEKQKTFDAIFSTCDTLIHPGVEEAVIAFALAAKKPSFTCDKKGVMKGHLIGNVSDFEALGRIAGEKAALILKGAEPSWLTTEALRENYIIINKETANRMGLPIPRELLEIAKAILFD